MKLLIINKYYFVTGGPERYMFQVTKLLEEHGHTVIPLALKLKRNLPTPYADDFLPPVADEEASHFGDFSLSIAKKARLTARAIYYPTARRRVAEIVRRENIDAVLLLNISSYISPSVIDGAKETGARVVMRLSDFGFICASYTFLRDGKVCTDCLTDGMQNAIRHRCLRGSITQSASRVLAMKIHRMSGIYRKVDAFVAPSQYMADTLVRFGMPAERVHCVPSFVNLDEYPPSFEPGGYVLSFGRLDADKGIDVLLRAWKALGDAAPPLRIVGSGAEEDTLKQLAADLNLHNISFTGFTEKAALTDIIASAAFVIIPSLWNDNSPMAAYETMALGKAIIASGLGGLRDQVEDGVSGLLVPPADPEALAQAVAALWADLPRARQMGIAGRERMETLFSPQRHYASLESLFRGD
jgi:glycosyltransferase involved in cell wall biosynthesis